MKAIISLLVLAFVCSAFAADEDINFDKGPEGALKCETRREYAACYYHCVQSGFKKAECKDKQCECADRYRFPKAAEEESEGVPVDELDADLKCTTRREYYQCYKHCKEIGFKLPYCKNKQCVCLGDRGDSMTPYGEDDNSEIVRNPRATHKNF